MSNNFPLNLPPDCQHSTFKLHSMLTGFFQSVLPQSPLHRSPLALALCTQLWVKGRPLIFRAGFHPIQPSLPVGALPCAPVQGNHSPRKPSSGEPLSQSFDLPFITLGRWDASDVGADPQPCPATPRSHGSTLPQRWHVTSEDMLYMSERWTCSARCARRTLFKDFSGWTASGVLSRRSVDACLASRAFFPSSALHHELMFSIRRCSTRCIDCNTHDSPYLCGEK